jgi:hypothetical protein
VSTEHIVQPSLFDRVTEYSSNIADGDVEPKEALSETSPIIVFCENFFLQFFKNLTGRTVVLSKSETAKELSVRSRRRRKGGELVHSATTRRVFVAFEELCDMWDDVHGLSYGLVTREFVDFHESLLPKLLSAIVEWTSELGDEELHAAAVAAEEAFADVVDEFVAGLNEDEG